MARCCCTSRVLTLVLTLSRIQGEIQALKDMASLMVRPKTVSSSGGSSLLSRSQESQMSPWSINATAAIYLVLSPVLIHH